MSTLLAFKSFSAQSTSLKLLIWPWLLGVQPVCLQILHRHDRAGEQLAGLTYGLDVHTQYIPEIQVVICSDTVHGALDSRLNFLTALCNALSPHLRAKAIKSCEWSRESLTWQHRHLAQAWHGPLKPKACGFQMQLKPTLCGLCRRTSSALVYWNRPCTMWYRASWAQVS